jgi:hypothetical protein
MSCDSSDCYLDCDESTTLFKDKDYGDSLSKETVEEVIERRFVNAQIGMLEAFILAFFLDGGDYSTHEFSAAVHAAIETMALNAELPNKLKAHIKED